MAFTVDELLRLPILVLIDAVAACRIKYMWSMGTAVGYVFSVSSVIAAVSVFCCKRDVLSALYSLLSGVITHCALQSWYIALTLTAHRDYYSMEEYHSSLFTKLTNSIFLNRVLDVREIDYIAKLSISLAVSQILHCLTLSFLRESFSPLSVLITICPAWAMMFNISPRTLVCFILLSNLPVLIRCLKKVRFIYENFDYGLPEGENVNLDQLVTFAHTTWVTCRVPSVLRLYFIFKCVWGVVILTGGYDSFLTGNYDTQKRSGLYYFFIPSENNAPSKDYWDDLGGYSHHGKMKRNLTFIEGMSAILTDSLISSFSVGAALSVVGHAAGVGLHNFVGGNDIMQGEALGMMSSILFCLLAIQTGLSHLPPWKRIVRLYRNSFLLASAVLHFFLDVVHPVLMSISPQSHMPLRKHIRPLLVCVILLIIPTALCYWLLTTKSLSTWMVALTAFNFELIVKVISTLLVYALYVADSRLCTNGILYLDEYVFWIRSVSHVIEFLCGLVMFVNGAYILFFESSNLLRAIMMTMHAYVNIYRTFREGLKTLNNRRTVNNKIASLTLVKLEDIDENDRDVCSICYQDFDEDNGEVRKTKCNHMFHSLCLRKWIFIQDSCPMCDRALFPTKENEEKKD